MGNKISGISLHKVGLTALIWILVFQSPLEKVWDPFSYIDEFTALIGACLGLYDIVIVRKGRPSKEQLWMGIPLLAFIAVGLAGNVIYQYQPLKCVIIDLYTNLKFFFAIGTGYYLFASMAWEEMKKTAGRNAQIITLCLFTLFLIDRAFHIWPSQVRYGISSAVLFYFHPTYLAGAMAFLLGLLILSYDRKKLLPIIMALVMMVFTLRSKAIAGAAAFVFFFFFSVVLKQRIKVWHLTILGSVCVCIGLPLLRFYYVEWGLSSPRAWLTAFSVRIMCEYFPIGTGFGTFASAMANKNFSPVYVIYNLEQYVSIHDGWRNYLSDTFWPIIFGQTGIIGTCAFCVAMFQIAKSVLQMHKKDMYAYVSAISSLTYLLISSTSEPSFHHSTAIPLALIFGILLGIKKGINEKE